MRTYSVALLTALFFNPAASADLVTLPNTEVRNLRAASNEIDYKLYVALPPGYADDARKRYGVVYVLDADYSFAIARNVIEHLSDRDHLEPLIVVGIAYGGSAQYRLNRTRDYTPTHTLAGGYGPEMQKHSGGGARFRSFLAAELIPFIDATYRTIPGRRCLSGHSYGGLFTSWTLLTATEGLFDRYLIVSPSLWYDERMIFSLERRLNGTSKPKGKVYLAVGSREGNRDRDMVEDLQRFAAVLRRRDTLRVRHEVLTDETHNSVFPSAFSRGLRWLFDGR